MSASSVSSTSGRASADVKYYLKFAINVPYADVQRMLETDTRLLYALKDCSRAGRVNWKLKLYKHQVDGDEHLAVYLKFEPQAVTESVSCSTEFSVKVAGPDGRSVERQSSSTRQFTKVDDSWGWSQFVRAADLPNFVSRAPPDGGGSETVLKMSGVIRIFESSKLLYPHRRHNFTRAQNGADFRIQVGQVTFHVHRALVALNSDFFAGLFARGDSEAARTGQVTLTDEKVQDVHLLLQFMYPGYSRVLEEATLLQLSRMAAKYQVHSLAWACMQFVDARLSEPAAVDPARAMKYYYVSVKSLRCADLADQCVRAAAGQPWRRVKEAAHFQLLDEAEKAAFLEAFLDCKEARRPLTPQQQQQQQPSPRRRQRWTPLPTTPNDSARADSTNEAVRVNGIGDHGSSEDDESVEAEVAALTAAADTAAEEEEEEEVEVTHGEESTKL